MRITKELERILLARKKAGEELQRYDVMLSEYFEARGIDIDDINTGIGIGDMVNCEYLMTEPQIMYDETIEAIKNYQKEIS